MSDAVDAISERYFVALETYLAGGGEPSLSQAYELGRRAMIEGLGVLDVATFHRAALGALVLSAQADDRARRAEAAGAFFQELLSPFEMSFRGYRAANDDLQALNETLRHQKVELENVNRELEAFSYSVSHDLRAPLRSIDGFSKALVEDFGGALGPAAHRYLGKIRDAAQRMGALIDDLLALGHLTRAPLRRGDVDVTEIVRRIADRLTREAPERSVAFQIQSGVRASADASLLTAVFENLLGNAWKFTSKADNARIEFGCEPRDDVSILYVRDNGAGFDMAYADKLFGAFQRLHTTNDFEGTGIGLATVQRIVHRHGGRVWAEGAVGAGATFYFTLSAGAPR
jgi:light-regulated signal transduction histidine kinase (bacteriophytochrome)